MATQVLPQILNWVQFGTISGKFYYANVLRNNKLFRLVKTRLVPKQYSMNIIR